MRIVLISPYDLALPGGVQGQVAGIASALARAGDAVLLVAPSSGEALVALDAGVELVAVGSSIAIRANGSRAPIAPYPQAVARARRALRGFRPDVIHVHEPFVPGPGLAGLFARATPVVATFHRSGADAAYRALGRLVAPLLDRLAGAVAVSSEARRTATAVFGARAGAWPIIANGVDVERFAGMEPVTPTRPTAMFHGRHEKRKGLAVLLEAFAGLNGDFELWIGSGGPERAELEQRYASETRLRWLGRLSEDEVVARLRGADLFVAPAIGGESFGVVLLEAMAARTAVLASEIPGYREALGKAGAYVRPGDVVGLRTALARLLEDANERERLAAEGGDRVRAFDFAAIAAQYRALYSA